MSSFIQFANATKLTQPQFEQVLETLRPVSCIISDGFLGWTQQSAEKLGIPRLVSFGTNLFSSSLINTLSTERPHAGVGSDDEPFLFPNFPGLKLTRNDFDPPLVDLEPKGEFFGFFTEQVTSISKSYGLVGNSFYELEPSFVDYWNQNIGPRAFCVGPLCLAKPPISQNLEKPRWVQWLDVQLAAGRPVLYVAFVTQADISPEQLQEIATGLEQSEVCFLWVSRLNKLECLEGLEDRMKGRGIVLNEWIDQMEVLSHQSIQGFLSHCGWNSVTESICAGVPLLALPTMADQHLNARMVVVEELGIGLRVMPSNGSVRGFVKSEEVQKMARELMEGERGA